MRFFILTLMLLLASGCVHQPEEQHSPAVTAVSDAIGIRGAGDGPTTAAYLNEAYHNKAVNCRSNPRAPAFLCSGVMLRATQHSTQFHFWNPNPSSTGVSFSYLRADSKFSKLVFGYNNGFIFYPYFFNPPGKLEPEILCFFPVDGATNSRDQQGCGQVPNMPSGKPCHLHPINTAAQYMTHYNQWPGRYGHLCGFDVRDVWDVEATNRFNEAIKAQGMGGTFAFNTQNEFRVAKWEQNRGSTLPIEAVFYVNDAGRAGAQYDQRDFKTQTGIWIPVIRITLPQTPTADVRFEYIPADQAISS